MGVIALEKEVIIPYEPSPKQYLFHETGTTELVYGGAKGGGKSCALIMDCFIYAANYPEAKCYLFRKTYDDLESNLISEWKAKIPSELYQYNESKHEATLQNGSIVKFRFVAKRGDSQRYQGRSFDYLGIDELTMHDEETVTDLMSCLRSVKGYPVRFRGTCNPGGVGHYWVKKRYIDATRHGKYKYRDRKTNTTVCFIPAKVDDNIVLLQNDPNYKLRLQNLPPKLRAAFLDGDWDIFKGMMFDEFDSDIHVVEPFTIPKHWKRWIACDNGYTDPFAWYWFAISEDGTIYIYREYSRDPETPKVTYSKQAEKVVELSKHTDIDDMKPSIEKFDMMIAGHDAWGTSPLSEQGKSIIDYYADGGLSGFVPAITDRRLRAAVWHEYLAPYLDENTGKMTAKLKIFSTCHRLIDTLPIQESDEHDPEKVAETGIDHWYDAAGYGLVAHHAAKSKKPKQKKSTIQEHKDKLAKQLQKKKTKSFI